MGEEINIYCDETRHLQFDKTNSMVIGAVSCSKAHVREIFKRIREIKQKHNLPKSFEIKWAKVSPSKVKFYHDLIDLFFDRDELSFRAVIINNKQALDHEKYKQTHDEFIYKMHYECVKVLLEPKKVYHIYIDLKDTQGGKKIEKLHEIICNTQADFKRKMIKSVVQIQGEQVELVQLCDLLIGALCYINNNFNTSKAKVELLKRIQERSTYNLRQTTLIREEKFNLLVITANSGPHVL
jgi:hypothetical protein